MKITQKDIIDNWNTDMTQESFVNNLFINTIWGKDENLNIKINSQDIKGFCKKQIKTNSKNHKLVKPDAGNLNAIINVFEMQKLKNESTDESTEFEGDQQALDDILKDLISEINKTEINTKYINNTINLKFYPAYRKLILKEFLLQNHKRIAFEKDVFDSFSSKHISFMEGPFFWGIVENLHQGKKYWQYFMSEGVKNLFKGKMLKLDEIHSAGKKSGSGIRLDHIIPRASLRTYFEKLCCQVNNITSMKDKKDLINTKVDWIYPYLVGCLVTKDENNWLKEQINPKNHDEHEVESPLDLYEQSKQDPNYLNSAKNLFKTYCEHNNLNKNNIKKQINILHFESNSWNKLDKTKDVQKIIENAKKSFFDPKTQSD
jgi:hypothetical protein